MAVQLKLVGEEGAQEDLLEGVVKDPVLEVFEFWKAMMEKAHAQLGDKRRRAIKAALKMGYTLDDLRLAIVGCKFDEWSQGQNRASRPFNDVELICRDETKIDHFIDCGNEYMKRVQRKDAEKVDLASKGVAMPGYVREKLDALFSKYKKP